jgi:hypothetical protein
MVNLRRVTFGESAAGGDEGDRHDSCGGKRIPLQEHLPTDFAG